MHKDHVNKRNTRTWIRLNEDTRAPKWRKLFCEEHGGEFVREGKNWKWVEVKQQQQEEEKKPHYLFEDPDGNIIEVYNVMKFCRENDLNKSAIYEVINGNRKHHKKFKFLDKRNDI